jgi:regulator of protease activity HflC (stomatin/prohibitin superfamily)
MTMLLKRFKPDKAVIVKDTHRALWYEDGVLVRVLGAGRYELPQEDNFTRLFRRIPKIEYVLVDMRERDLTIKGQEILTSDKVAIRVSIVVRFQVEDPRAAVQAVEDFEARLYTDVQLAARRSLASMKLEAILTNRTQLSEDILAEVTESATGYGVKVIRADVKDLVFPGNLEQIMNRVLTAERLAEAQLIEARSAAEVKRIESQARADIQRVQAEADNLARQRSAEIEAEIQRISTEAEIRDLKEREQAAEAYTQHPALMRLLELQTLRDLSGNADARIYVNFDSENGRDNEN